MVHILLTQSNKFTKQLQWHIETRVHLRRYRKMISLAVENHPLLAARRGRMSECPPRRVGSTMDLVVSEEVYDECHVA